MRSGENKWELCYPGKKELSVEFFPSAELIPVGSIGKGLRNNNENLLVFGENRGVLRTLLEESSIREKVQLVYIDPPFSTKSVFRIGNDRGATVSSSSKDRVAYQDVLSGPKYFEFLRERFFLLREILSDQGSIYVHIDTKIGHYVKILLDEVFGSERFINDITRIKSNPKNFSRKGYGNIKDMILFYSKTKDYIWNEPREDYSEADLKRLFPRINPHGRRYTTVPLHAPGETLNGDTGKPWRGIMPPKGRHWRYSPEILEQLDLEGKIEWSRNNVPRLIIYAEEKKKVGKKVQDVWEFKDPQYPSYPTEKNILLLKRIVSASSEKGGLVLDAFMGAGTTLVASEELGRRWIGIDNSIEAFQTAYSRLISFEELSKTNILSEKTALKEIKKVLGLSASFT